MAEKLDQKEKTEHDETTIAERIKFIRGSLTQVVFCRKLDIFRNTLQNWVADKYLPDFESILKFH